MLFGGSNEAPQLPDPDDPDDLEAQLADLDTSVFFLEHSAISRRPDPLATDPLATDPLATDPLATDPLATDPLAGESRGTALIEERARQRMIEMRGSGNAHDDANFGGDGDGGGGGGLGRASGRDSLTDGDTDSYNGVEWRWCVPAAYVYAPGCEPSM